MEIKHNGVAIDVFEGPYIEGGRLNERAVGDYTDLVSRLDEVKNFAADNLLELYNSTWRADEIGDLDRSGFKARLTNPAINLFEPGFAIVYFDDGDMFLGHSVEVHVEGGEPTHASIGG